MGERAGVCVLGSINLDIVCTVAELPAPGETVQALDLQRLPGGKGADQAVASACWGAATSLVGAVGLDEAADMLLAGLLDADVDISRVRRVADTPTGQAQICVSTAGENTIVVIGGANLAVAPTDIDPEVLEGCRVLLTQLETPLPAIEALFSASALGGAMRILNAAPAMAAGRNLFPLADVIVVNQTELARYAGGGDAPTSPQDVASAARRLISRADQTVVVTLGASGAAAVGSDDAFLVAGRPARVIDTTGAGDCFCGVLAASLAGGADIRGGLEWANAAAAVSTQTLGAAVCKTLRADVGALR